jgi:hypothetical protein
MTYVFYGVSYWTFGQARLYTRGRHGELDLEVVNKGLVLSIFILSIFFWIVWDIIIYQVSYCVIVSS